MNRINKYILVLALPTLLLVSCNKDLDRKPINSNISDIQYATPAGYKQVLAKAYGSYSLVSSNGVGNSAVNVPGITDAATTDFVRSWWNLQELTPGEGKIAGNDAN